LEGIVLYKCVLFDIDGTILDTEQAVIGSLQKLLQSEIGIEYSPDELAFVLGIPGAVALKRFNIPDIEASLQKWNQYLKEFYSNIHIFPHLKEVVETIYSLKIKTGIVTSKTKQELVDDFYPFGMQRYFDYIVCADDTKRHKPEPDPILKCLDLTKSSFTDTIYIGDTLYDMQCAESAGIDFVLALWGTKTPNLNATIKLSHPEKILNIIG
jgi:HAD superfamily hydrolase (TIGR01549 family)